MKNSAVIGLLVVLSAVIRIGGPSAGGSAERQASQASQQQMPMEQEVFCPVPDVRTEITTPLPKPWWNTPQVGKLESVTTNVIGGQNTLVCHYRAYGTTVAVMRRFPEGAHSCTASGDHFVCR